jgi:hypothetical protein
LASFQANSKPSCVKVFFADLCVWFSESRAVASVIRLDEVARAVSRVDSLARVGQGEARGRARATQATEGSVGLWNTRGTQTAEPVRTRGVQRARCGGMLVQRAAAEMVLIAQRVAAVVVTYI